MEVVEAVVAFAKETGFTVAGLDFSPIKGPEGNIEYLLYLKKSGEPAAIDAVATVERSHEALDK